MRRGCRVGSMIKSPGCSSRASKFTSKHTHGGLQPSIHNSIPTDHKLSSDFCSQACIWFTNMYRQNIHIHKMKTNKSFKKAWCDSLQTYRPLHYEPMILCCVFWSLTERERKNRNDMDNLMRKVWDKLKHMCVRNWLRCTCRSRLVWWGWQPSPEEAEEVGVCVTANTATPFLYGTHVFPLRSHCPVVTSEQLQSQCVVFNVESLPQRKGNILEKVTALCCCLNLCAAVHLGIVMDISNDVLRLDLCPTYKMFPWVSAVAR